MSKTSSKLNNLDMDEPSWLNESKPWSSSSTTFLNKTFPTCSNSNKAASSSSSGNIIPPTTPLASTTPAFSENSHHHQTHQSRSSVKANNNIGDTPKRDGSIENSFRPKNYRSKPFSIPEKAGSGDHLHISHQEKQEPLSLLTQKLEKFQTPLKIDFSTAHRGEKHRERMTPNGDGRNDEDDQVNQVVSGSSSPSLTVNPTNNTSATGYATDDEDDNNNNSDTNSNQVSSLESPDSSTQTKYLTNDNKILHNCLDNGRKALLVRKALTSFMYGALRKQSDRIHLVEMRVKMKTEECAARFILHSLLLNCYRRTKKDLALAHVENVQRNKSVENLCLQLRVVRHLQSTEKERAIERSHEISTLKSEISLLKVELEKSQQKLQAIERQMKEEEGLNEKLVQDKFKIQEELTNLQEQIGMVNGSLELEKKQVTKYLESSKLLKKQISESKHQIKELICQSNQWQERARTFESENWELQLKVQNGDKDFNHLKSAYNVLMEQNKNLVSEKESLHKQRAGLELRLNDTNNESFILQENISSTQAELEKQKMIGLELQEILTKYRDENSKMKKELFKYKLRNVSKRRAWVQFIMSIINPLETIRLYVIGPTNESSEEDDDGENNNVTYESFAHTSYQT